MKKLFFTLIFIIAGNLMALSDNPSSKSTPTDYKVSDANLTKFIFNEIKTNNEQPGDITFLYEQYKLASRQHWIKATEQLAYAQIDDKLYADYLNESYRQSKSQEDKEQLDKQLQTIKKSYKLDYKPMPIKDQFAKIDVKGKTYILDGVTYDINDRAAVKDPVVTPPEKKTAKNSSADNTDKKTVAQKKKAVITVGPLSKGKIIPDEPSPSFTSCVWDNANPRSVVYGPGCNADGSCLCRGHVICKRNGQQKRRLATCSEKYCTDETPSECSAELGFGSQIPQN